MASFASSATTGGARKHAWTKISIREAIHGENPLKVGIIPTRGGTGISNLKPVN